MKKIVFGNSKSYRRNKSQISYVIGITCSWQCLDSTCWTWILLWIQCWARNLQNMMNFSRWLLIVSVKRLKPFHSTPHLFPWLRRENTFTSEPGHFSKIIQYVLSVELDVTSLAECLRILWWISCDHLGKIVASGSNVSRIPDG